jgi:hypothetical protein
MINIILVIGYLVGGGHTVALMEFEGVSPRVLNRFVRQMVAGVTGRTPE